MRVRTRGPSNRADLMVTHRSFYPLDSCGFKEIPPIHGHTIVELRLSGNTITSFQGLLRLPRLEILRCDNMLPISFKSAIPQPMLHDLTSSLSTMVSPLYIDFEFARNNQYTIAQNI
jgi:hypothetical protein